LIEHIANTFFFTKNVGSPCESFSHVSGSARHSRRTRSACFSPDAMRRLESVVSFFVDFMAAYHLLILLVL
jgi:hypothetical protein